tara:strand:+ start:137 stop:520 length:384 start_codon:yes stop_codon:yes gene_type:complete
MKVKVKESHEFKIYIGSVYENEAVSFCSKVPFSESLLSTEIAEFQDNYPSLIPIRITKTTFVCGTPYREEGWEVAIINYPRLSVKIKDLEEFAEDLAEYLLDKFKQNRVTLVTPHASIMYEEEHSPQ